MESPDIGKELISCSLQEESKPDPLESDEGDVMCVDGDGVIFEEETGSVFPVYRIPMLPFSPIR